MKQRCLLEYIWMDAKNNFRSKVKIEVLKIPFVCSDLEIWNFDGSSTGQATGEDSEIFIKPYMVLQKHKINMMDVIDNTNNNYYYVFCECLNTDMKTPHKTNTRTAALEFFNQPNVIELDPMFGIEQEFFVFKDGKPILWKDESTLPQADYYCGNGSKSIIYTSRIFLDKVVNTLNRWGINTTGYNFEVAPGQMEIQICEKSILASDYLIALRFILTRYAEEYGWDIILTPKPEFLSGDNWNGSGCHVNFSTSEMRLPCNNDQSISLNRTVNLIQNMKDAHSQDIIHFGSENNKLRLGGKNETSAYDTFTYGIANRGSSIRIPRYFVNNLYGYIEDRRPGADMDPYVVTKIICSYALTKNQSVNSDISKQIVDKHCENNIF
jgi:glutamine synthetase